MQLTSVTIHLCKFGVRTHIFFQPNYCTLSGLQVISEKKSYLCVHIRMLATHLCSGKLNPHRNLIISFSHNPDELLSSWTTASPDFMPTILVLGPASPLFWVGNMHDTMGIPPMHLWSTIVDKEKGLWGIPLWDIKKARTFTFPFFSVAELG